MFKQAVQAIITGEAETLKQLLADHPELIHARSESDHQATLLHYVAANGVEDELQKTPANAVEIANILIDAGADVNAICETYGGGNAQTTLNLLVSSGHPAERGVQADLVRVLCQAGAKVNGLDNDGLPLITAIAFHYQKAAKALVDCGARTNSLLFSSALGNLDAVRHAFENGKLKDDALQSSVPSAKTLLSWTGRDLQSTDYESAVLSMALFYGSVFNQINVVKFLLEQGVDVNSTFQHNQTGLHIASWKGHFEMVKLLVEHGADPTIQDTQHESTPIGWADQAGHTEIVNYLRDTVA